MSIASEWQEGGGLRSLFLAVVCGLSVVTGARAADDAPPGASTPIVQLFVTLCVNNAGGVDRIETAAAAMSLKPITSLEGIAVAQAGPDAQTRAWRVSGAAGAPFALSVSEGRQRGKTITVCALTDPAAVAQPVEQALIDRLHLGRPFRREPEADQNRTYWDATVDGQKMVISATDATPSGHSGVSLATTVTRR